MSLRDSWRIAGLTRERDALAVLCLALIDMTRGATMHSDAEDLKKAVNILIDAAESYGMKGADECDRARDVVNGSDSWIGECGEWRMKDIVDDILEYAERKGL